MANYKSLSIGATVRIRPHTGFDDEKMYDGQVGKIVDIDEHADEGDFYGVEFPASTLDTISHTHAIYFTARELEVIS